MIQLETISVRHLGKGPAHQFFNSDLGIREYVETNFKNNGKLVSMSSNISEDYTTETKKLIFKSQEDYEEYINDEILQYQAVLQTRYNRYHNIVFNQTATPV
jgi:uncharacterized protein YeeX (DUF496 family)